MPPRWKRCVRRGGSTIWAKRWARYSSQKTFGADTKQRAVDDDPARSKRRWRARSSNCPGWAKPPRSARSKSCTRIVNKIGYPDQWRDYSSVKILRGDFFGNVRARHRSSNPAARSAKIGKPVDRSEWQMTPPTVNAYYDPQMNDINFPAGVLQPPLFDPKMDDAPNYGNTGATIGHELTHGFDDEGRQFDAKGNLKDWWTKQDAAEFEKRADCVSDQYAQYTIVDDIKINGKLTLGEDVADLGGTFLAYLAWKDATEGSEPAAHRRAYARPALLRRHGAVGLRRRAPGEQARERHHQSALAAGIPHQRRGLEHAGVRQSVLVQSGPADGPAEPCKVW